MTPAELCLAYLDSLAAGDADTIASFVDDDFVNDHTAALGSSCRGATEYRRRLPAFLASMPGLSYEVEDVVAEGDRVAVAYTMHARPNDRPLVVRGVMWFEVNDGRIVRRVDYWDSEVARSQMEAPPT